MVDQASPDENPYGTAPKADRLDVGETYQGARIGLVLSVVAFAGLLAVMAIPNGYFGCYVIAACVTSLAWPGTLISLFALKESPRRKAVYGTIIGFYTSAHVATVFLPIIQWMRRY